LNASLEVLGEFLYSDNLSLPKEKVKGFELSLNLCDDEQIQTLNRDYREKDKVTDVLSFPVHDSLRPGEVDEMFMESILNLGDVIICKSVAEKQSIEYKVTYEQEITHLLVHGVLHLCGFDHELSEEEEKIMFAHEEVLVEKIYNKIGL
jgi:probable rRNA maturation factor